MNTTRSGTIDDNKVNKSKVQKNELKQSTSNTKLGL
jgi:hypothetical protein